MFFPVSSFAQGNPVQKLDSAGGYGRVIYQVNSHLPQQIYIIGQAHRSALTGECNQEIVRVQAEIYRIGEWLIQQQKVGMLLPEGYFLKTQEGISVPEGSDEDIIRLDNRSLEAMLADTRRFVNADMLLNSSYRIPLGQVENEQLYRNILQLLQKAGREKDLSILSKLDGLQVERTAVMLQNIPDLLEQAHAAGKIKRRQAMFTIGLNHVKEIIGFLKRGSLRDPAASDPSSDKGTTESSLKLLEQGYGVTVILPRALAENEKILAHARLNPADFP
ncbi:MAG: hypothetical protein R2940_13040 [Syntrophotaleaceae bacterium]